MSTWSRNPSRAPTSHKRRRAVRALATAAGLVLTLGALTPAQAACPDGMTPEEAEAASEVIPYRLETREGPILIGLLPGVAPQTVAEFMAFADAGAYDDGIFHNAWLDGTEALTNVAIDTGLFRHTDAEGFQMIDLPATTVPDETCLENVRGAVISLVPRTFDGSFEIYVRDPKITWCEQNPDNCFLDTDYIVFGRLIDAAGVPLDSEGDLGPAGVIGEYLGADGFLTLDDPMRRELRRLPVDLDRTMTLEEQVALSDTAACYRIGQLPVPTVALVRALDPPRFVQHDIGVDAGELVVATTPDDLVLNDGACGDLINNLISANGGNSWLPETFTCDDQEDPQTLLLWQTENRCNENSLTPEGFLSPNCFIQNLGGDPPILTSIANCSFLAASELMLDVRREELNPQLTPLLAKTTTVPEPGLGPLGFAGIGAVAALRRRRGTRQH